MLKRTNRQPRSKKIRLLARWRSVSNLLKLATVSTMVENIEAPLNVLLVGPPGDGKSKMLLRVARAPNVKVMSDTTYMGLTDYLIDVRDGFVSCLVIPDIGTLVGRRTDVGAQTIATLAMMSAEGVFETRIGRRLLNYNGARSSVLSAVTPDMLNQRLASLDTNAFLSRVLLLNFDLSWLEIERMAERKHLAVKRDLLTQFNWRGIPREKGSWIRCHVSVSKRYAGRALKWWREVRRRRKDRFFAFRTADQIVGFLQSSAYLHGRASVGRDDVLFVDEHVIPFMMEQFRLPQQLGQK